jgi:hypothetical protein
VALAEETNLLEALSTCREKKRSLADHCRNLKKMKATGMESGVAAPSAPISRVTSRGEV